MYKYLFALIALFFIGTSTIHAQADNSTKYLASFYSHAPIDTNGIMGEFSEWAENKATIKYFKLISLFIVIPENQEKGTGYFVQSDGFTESTNEKGDTESLYKCRDAEDNPANIIIVKSKTPEGQIVIYLIKEKECSAYFISQVENPEV